MRFHPPPFTSIYATLDATGFHHIALIVLNPMMSTFSTSSSTNFDYNVTFTIAIATHGARTPSWWGTGSSWRSSQAT
jgi:protoheme ferro-lyase